MAVAVDGAMPNAAATEGAIPGRYMPQETRSVVDYAQSSQGRRILQMLAAAAVIALMVGIWMWGQTSEYRVLFSNFSDRDGGAIVASLQQMNAPYKFSEGGAAILVPENMVHDVRLRLAAQGLPRGGNVGFELMESQKLGASQFLEQVNFQRALEGELARSIQSLSAVQAARVHLALPKASVFVRDQQKPTASVVLSLYPGRMLDSPQVSAIVHLVASSVPGLSPSTVTVVDQNGNLLSGAATQAASGLDSTQLKYVQELQQDIVKRVESILAPIVGNGNVRAEATADVDFTRSEQAAETYTPNQAPDAAAVRSKQNSESQSSAGSASGGVPGALSNQPPAPATAPITNPPAAAAGAPEAANAATPPGTSHKDATINYEVDKTVRYVQQPMGGIKRLTVAVVINYKRVEKSGKVTMEPLTDDEKNQISDLVKEAMGYNKDRGDSLNIVNTQFNSETVPELSLLERIDMIQLAKDIAKYVLLGAVLLFLYFKALRPIVTKLTSKEEAVAPAGAMIDPNNPDAVVQLSGGAAGLDERHATYQANLEAARKLAKDDPKLVASIVKTWVNNE